MCGRVVQSSGPIRLAIVDGLNVRDNRSENVRRRYNAAPSPGAAGDPAEPQDGRAVPRPSQVGPNPALVTSLYGPLKRYLETLAGPQHSYRVARPVGALPRGLSDGNRLRCAPVLHCLRAFRQIAGSAGCREIDEGIGTAAAEV